jgi:hypothetical protein
MSSHRIARLALLGVSLLAACSAERAPAAQSAWAVSPAGIGAVQAGQSLAAVGAVLGETLHASYSSNERCDHVRSTKLPAGVKLMVQADTVVRVEIDSGTVRTVEGAGVGDSESRVLAMFRGRVTTRPHKYTGPTGHYLVVDDPADPRHRIVFETDGARVTSYRAGNRAAVDLVEGCS